MVDVGEWWDGIMSESGRKDQRLPFLFDLFFFPLRSPFFTLAGGMNDVEESEDA